MKIRRSTGAIARSTCGIIFVVSPEHEWQVRHGPAQQFRFAPFGCVGGKLEPGELPADAVRREIAEETSGANWTVPGRAGGTYAFLRDGTEVAWEARFGMPGTAANPDLVIIEDNVNTAEWLLYGFAAAVSGDPRPSGGHPALVHIPWRMLPELYRRPGKAMTGADVLANEGRIVPDEAVHLLRGVLLFPIGTARFLCAMSSRSPAHPVLAELGLIPAIGA